MKHILHITHKRWKHTTCISYLNLGFIAEHASNMEVNEMQIRHADVGATSIISRFTVNPHAAHIKVLFRQE